jgi:hypothetical protein
METHKNENQWSGGRQMRAPLDRVLGRDTKEDRPLSHGAPSKPLLGVLPIARLIPQDVHAMMDYGNGVAAGSGALMTDDPAARIASLALAATTIGISAVTDYRLSVAKLVPIEAHEVADYAWGLAAIAAPFVLGYWKKDPIVSTIQIATGVTALIGSLFTDYRGYRGVKW